MPSDGGLKPLHLHTVPIGFELCVGEDVLSEETPLIFEAKGKKGKRTYQPNVLHRKRTHGFLRRNNSDKGRDVLERRRKKGRWQIATT